MNDPWLTLSPAYGRDYTTAEVVLAAWNRDRDFRIQDVSSPHNGRYINREDASTRHDHNNLELKAYTFKIRFNKLADFCLLKWKGTGWYIAGVSYSDEGKDQADIELLEQP